MTVSSHQQPGSGRPQAARSPVSTVAGGVRLWVGERGDELLLVLSLGLLGAGGLAWLVPAPDAASVVWVGATVLGLVLSLGWTARALRQRRPSVDVIAVLALAGALLVGEPFAGAVITVMLTTGQALEARAGARAKRELSLLVARAPRTARRRVPSGAEVVAVDEVAVGDRLLVGSGEVVPVDGRLQSPAILDESALTGEPLPVEYSPGDAVRSGVVNAGAPFELVTTAAAAESTYAGVVRLVAQAQATSAPFVRLADRIAVLFVPVTLLLAAAAWLVSADPVRAVAVLVVATPCPLLLAAPIAVMSGLSRAASIGVVVKGGAALERLAAARVMLFDKTGTLTWGRPTLTEVVVAETAVPADEALRLAASLEQLSPHVLATAMVTAARGRGLTLRMPQDVREVPGYGLSGRVEDHRVKVGKLDWVVGQPHPTWVRQARRRAALDGTLTVFVAVDDVPVAALLLQDLIRPDAPRMVRALRDAGIERVVLLTGDRADVAELVGRVVGVDSVLADCDPADKLAAVSEQSRTSTTVMVGDGVNDAPALAAADVGVALAARGATASSETADIVLTVDRLDRLADATLLARRSRRIAWQAVGVGMGLSLVAMLVAAAGLLTPAAGAVLQEVIDVLAIGIALRGVLPGRVHTIAMTPADTATARALRTEHDAVLAVVEQIRAVADGLSTQHADLQPVRALLGRLQDQLIQHERADERLLVPIVARALGAEATAALSRTHAEIEHQTSRLKRLLTELDGEIAQPEDIVELRRLLYGLYAILRLHNAQEDEGAFSLLPAQPHQHPAAADL